MSRRLLRTLIVTALLAIALLVTACGQEAEKLNQDGNEAFAKEAYAEALAAYEGAQIENPELAEPYYNAANALYREGAFAEALQLLEEALRYTDAELLEQNSFYNQGNSAFNLEEWESAVAAYTEALLRNPDDQEAKYNLELALRQMLEQQQEQEQQENEEQQEEQDQDSESEEESPQDQSDDGQQEQEQEQDEEQESDQSSNDEQEQEQEQGSGEGQPEESEEQPESQSQMPRPGQRMTAEQARQLLEAIAQDTETLQERLGQIFIAPPIPPTQDW